MSTAFTEHEYILGTKENELARLGFQHRLWSKFSIDAWLRAGFGPGQTIVDVGSGPGYASFDLAQLVGPTGRVVAVDASQRFIDHVNRVAAATDAANVHAIVSDVQAMALDPGVADGAYARWVLCFVERPEEVVNRVASALKPGGRFIVHDYSNYLGVHLAPKSDVMRKVVEAVDRSWRMRGSDPDVASRVPTMMREAGLDVADVRPITRVARPSDALWSWPVTFFRNYLPVLESLELITREDSEAWLAMWEDYSRSSTAVFSSPPMLEVTGVKR